MEPLGAGGGGRQEAGAATDSFDLTGRTAVVTGASGAIGGAIARGLARAGAAVALGYNRNRDAARMLADAIAAAGSVARAYHVDALNPDSFERNAAEVVADFDGVDILVNSDGGNLTTPHIAAMTHEAQTAMAVGAAREIRRVLVDRLVPENDVTAGLRPA